MSEKTDRQTGLNYQEFSMKASNFEEFNPFGLQNYY